MIPYRKSAANESEMPTLQREDATLNISIAKASIITVTSRLYLYRFRMLYIPRMRTHPKLDTKLNT